MRVRAKVAYDGAEFFGFQRQSGVRSVQGEIEKALETICGQRIAVIGAGRTDAGVHATGQVIAFNVDWRHSLEALMRALNASLPNDVAVSELAECDERFHPRFSAVSRTYEYRVYISPVRHPLLHRYAWQILNALDAAQMNRAAECLIGEHDFAAFGSPPSGDEHETTIREVLQAEWRETEKDKLTFTIEANAFLFRMVRRIVMALIRVGQGQWRPEDVTEILHSRDMQRIKGLAPACGLCLVNVNY